MKKALIIFIVGLIGIITCLLVYYNYSLKGVGDPTEKVVFTVSEGMTARNAIDSLYNDKLIRNKYTGYIYLKLHNNIMIQKGKYELDKGMSLDAILTKLAIGEIIDDSISVTFIEGKRVPYYIEEISKIFNFPKQEVEDTFSNKEYLKKLINKYWFLDEIILNKDIYYPLEGYLYPDTYYFYKTSSIEDIIEKLLDMTDKVLSKYKDQMGEYSPHEILSMASIIELEAVKSTDRRMVSQVIYKRLKTGMTLGMDVTTYYAVKKSMSEELWYYDLDVNNPYNTRVVQGLPIGPICSPSKDSIDAALNPSDTDYIYFYADVTTGEVHFAKDYNGFSSLINKYGK